MSTAKSVTDEMLEGKQTNGSNVIKEPTKFVYKSGGCAVSKQMNVGQLENDEVHMSSSNDVLIMPRAIEKAR